MSSRDAEGFASRKGPIRSMTAVKCGLSRARSGSPRQLRSILREPGGSSGRTMLLTSQDAFEGGQVATQARRVRRFRVAECLLESGAPVGEERRLDARELGAAARHL